MLRPLGHHGMFFGWVLLAFALLETHMTDGLNFERNPYIGSESREDLLQPINREDSDIANAISWNLPESGFTLDDLQKLDKNEGTIKEYNFKGPVTIQVNIPAGPDPGNKDAGRRRERERERDRERERERDRERDRDRRHRWRHDRHRVRDNRHGTYLYFLGGNEEPKSYELFHWPYVPNKCKRSHLWHSFRTYTLSTNMLAGTSETTPIFADWLLELGDGTLPAPNEDFPDLVEIPEICRSTDVVQDIFGTAIDIARPGSYINKIILTPRNGDTFEINEKVLQKIPGETKVYYSADSVPEDDQEGQNYQQELLNSLTPSGMPSHKLSLKIGAVVMLMRDLNVYDGLCNGTRLIVTHLHTTVMQGVVVTGVAKGQRMFIPRIDFCSSDSKLPFQLKRRQFPVQLAFCMTVDKAQGQTIQNLGIFLPNPVFTHGQLYMAFSRARKFEDVKVQVDQTAEQGTLPGKKGIWTRNVVYKELLL